jgi:hypothetical protein
MSFLSRFCIWEITYNIFLLECSLFHLSWWYPIPSRVGPNSILLYGSIMDTYHIFFTHSSVNGHLNWFYSLAIINSAKINMGVQISVLYADFDFFRYVPRSGMAGSYDSSIFGVLRNLHTYFHSGCNNLHSNQQCIRVPFSPTSSQAFVLFVFLKTAILTEICWNLNVALICISFMAKEVCQNFLNDSFFIFLMLHLSLKNLVTFDEKVTKYACSTWFSLRIIIVAICHMCKAK